ncbi:hypothetical protein SVAN01_04867 [Stagonosporopsis vannaccii]|nr:hypothetical protein SVAN01_04867 [Stagonosporopsis vannaccii]
MSASLRSAPIGTAPVRKPQDSDAFRLSIPTSPPPTLYHRVISFIRDRRQSYCAPRNARLNQTQCVFYRLPAELHASIARYLLGADLLSYAQCSQKTTWLVHHFQPPRSVKAAFAARLRRDHDIRRLTRSGFNVQTVAWCSSHLKLHHVALFAKSQLSDSISNDERVCVGVKGRFRGCEHQSFSIAELRREMLDPLPHLCNKHVDVDEGISGPHIVKWWLTSGPVFASTRLIQRLPFWEKMDALAVQSILIQLRVHICPHLTSADESVLNTVCTVKNQRHCNDDILVEERKAFSKTGFCAYCRAEYTLHRHEGGSSLLLDVRRKVQNLLDSPVSENVLVHLEDCGDVHCAYKEGSIMCKYSTEFNSAFGG